RGRLRRHEVALVALVEVVVGRLGHAVVARSDTGGKGDRAAERPGRTALRLLRRLLRGRLPVHRAVAVGPGLQQCQVLHRLEGLGARRVRRLLAVACDDRRPGGLLVEGDALLPGLTALAPVAALAALALLAVLALR